MIVIIGGYFLVEKWMVEFKENGEIVGKIFFVDDYKKYGFRYFKEYWYNEKDNLYGVWFDLYNVIVIVEVIEEVLI